MPTSRVIDEIKEGLATRKPQPTTDAMHCLASIIVGKDVTLLASGNVPFTN